MLDFDHRIRSFDLQPAQLRFMFSTLNLLGLWLRTANPPTLTATLHAYLREVAGAYNPL